MKNLRTYLSTILLVAACLNLAAGEPVRISLDGEWEFRQAGEDTWRNATVPGCVHTDLLAHNTIEDPFYGRNEKSLQWIGEKDWEYRKTFYIDENVVSAVSNVWLVLEGVDTYATVSVNGLPVVETGNMFRTYRVDLKNVLRNGENEISVKFESVFKRDFPKYLDAPYKLQAWPNNDQSDIWLSLYARKAGYNYGWDWGPRLITTGLWKPVYIETWKDWKIESVQLKTLTLDGVSVKSGKAAKARMQADVHIESEVETQAEITVLCDGKKVYKEKVQIGKGDNLVPCLLTVRNPELWWSNGLGKAALHDFEVAVETDGSKSSFTEKAGIRTAEIIREDDSQGRSLSVRLNGTDVFCKGANWIPIDNFPNRKNRADYDRLISDATACNMNMLRVWGGGLYEGENFYNVCDSLGIMIWQDMAFACGMFPSDQEYLDNVAEEVKDNVRRLRNHPSLVLWCGNNENEISYFEWGWNRTLTPSQQEDYETGLKKLFYEVIPEAIASEDDTRYYHPSSPSTGHSGVPYSMGDAHMWSVWKGGWVEEYLKPENIARFMSEYGFIAYPDMISLNKFIPSWDMSASSGSMLAHHRAYDDVTRDPEYSNKMIARYMSRYAWIPEKFEDFVYMTQWFQAEVVKVAMEAHRRAKPYCMGTLYWQINDCWPAISWSSIDYYGRWKALQYYARRAYAPILASPYIDKEGNIAVKVVSDRAESFNGVLETIVMDFDGKVITEQKMDCCLKANEAEDIMTIDGKELEGNRFLLVSLTEGGKTISENTFFSRYANEYEYGRPSVNIKAVQIQDGVELTITSDRLARGFCLFTDNDEDFFEDNYIDLVPGREYKLKVRTKTTAEEFKTTIKYQTL